ncbi:MAG TPA: DUF3089 domain-containing protein [Cytophagales bacterium]|nr:DUF3089 domain-containing protein [Cytophagales bacterium]HAA22592.1 DUF3089 domain-containing protein [Cytophagales bacterium]HAP63539.1 DUF3089 domain-containing protein [Cytophagales bacterium]
MKPFSFLSMLLVLSLMGCNKVVTLSKSFEESPVPPTPDYSNPDHWAALPTKADMADGLPDGKVADALVASGELADRQTEAAIDVFFLYPTIYTYEPTQANEWNADVNDLELNDKVEQSTIKHQASLFNGVGKIYAPRYRQGHYYMYLTPNKEDAEKAAAIAYADVKAAFEYYLKHYNQGRPFIIASHSQGSQMGRMLVRDYIDGKTLQEQLVAAYLVGWAIPPDYYDSIEPCTAPSQTGCWMTWNTKGYGHYPKYYEQGLNRSLSVNPITWSVDQPSAGYEDHLGGVNAKYALLGPESVDAHVQEGLLWVHPPKIPGAKLARIKNWHRADYNLFWLDVRRNAQLRAEAFLSR